MTTLNFSQAPELVEADTVIVGAGISGLYMALRLVEHDPTIRIAIIERLNRTGGRLDTDLIHFKDGNVVREEEGGMRFNYDMNELMHLVGELDLCGDIVPFPMSTPGDTNRFHIRGRSFTKHEAASNTNKIWSELFDLNEDPGGSNTNPAKERGLSPTDIVINAFEAVLEANNDTNSPGRTPESWAEVRNTYTWQGITLNNWQMWGLLRSMGHSEECIQMLSETIGFAGPFMAPINAGDAFQILADFPKDPDYLTFTNGFSTLPDTIRGRLEDDYGDRVTIMLSTNVDSFERTDTGFTFVLTEAPDNQNSNPYIPGGKTKIATSNQVVIAVATAGMERLFATSPALNADPQAPVLWEAIHAARGMKLMKINLYFDAPWWENGGIDPAVQFGPNFSGLPINAVYPFYSLTEDDTIPPDAPAALTIYCDFNNTNFWAGMQNLTPAFESDMQTIQNNKVPQTLYGASQPLVDEAIRQLKTLFSIAEIPEPVLTSYRLWDGADDFEYAYHQWRVGVNDIDVRGYLSSPVDDVFFCNEAISDMQGWVNGSLRSCNDALQRIDCEIKPLDGARCTKPDAGVATDPSAASPRDSRRATPGLWGG